MVNVFCDEPNRRDVAHALGAQALISLDWQEFISNARDCSCMVLVVAVGSLEQHGALLTELAALRVPLPIVIATAIDAANIELLGRIRYERFVPLLDTRIRLAEAVKAVQNTSSVRLRRTSAAANA